MLKNLLRVWSVTSDRRRRMRSSGVCARIPCEVLESRALLSTFHVDGSVANSGNGSEAAPYATIQEGINAAAAANGDDTVLIEPGVYTESLLVNDTSGNLTISGSPGITTGVTVNGGGQDVFLITPQFNVTVNSLFITNGDRGIRAQGGPGSLTVDNVQGTNFARASMAGQSISAVTVRNSQMSGGNHGLWTSDVASVDVQNSVFTQHRFDGLQFRGTASLSVTDVTATGNSLRGIAVFGATGTTTLQNITASTNDSIGIAVYNGRTDLTIDGAVANGNGHHGVDITAVTSATLSNMTVQQNGAAAGSNIGGGGMRVQTDLSGAVLRIQDSLFEDNVEDFSGGGGLLLAGNGSFVIDRTTVRGNASQYSVGGGILLNSTGAGSVIRDSVIEGNSGTFGGGIYYGAESGGGTLLIERTTIDSNSSTGDGGEGFAPADGGGLFVWNRTLTIDSSTISNNAALSNESGSDPASGGGLAIQASAVTVQNSTISGNTAGFDGAGIAMFNGSGNTVRLVHTTVTDNTSDNIGGGIYRDAGADQLWIGNSVIAGNQSVFAGPDIAGVVGDLSFNLIGDASGSTGANSTSNLVGTASSPIDPVLGPLSDNGGPTFTHALLNGSPAIDAVGASNFVFNSDQRGVARPQGPKKDIGAVEQIVPPALSLNIRSAQLNESGTGTSTTGFVTRSSNSDMANAIIVTLHNSDTSELSLPATVIIAAGQTTSPFFNVTAVNDNIVDGDQNVLITASATGYLSATDSVEVVDTTPVNTPPVADNQSLNVDEDQQLTGVLTASDVDADSITYQLVSGPSHEFAFSFSSSGHFSYSPQANFNGDDSFTFRAYDGTDFSAPATISISVLAINDAPTADNDTATTAEDAEVVISVLTNDGDIDGDSLTVSISSDGTNGAATANANGTVSYTPNADFNGTDTFTYTVSDGNGGFASADVQVTVTPENDAPTDLTLSGDTLAENVDTTNSVAVGNLSATDIDGDELTFTLAEGTADNDRFEIVGGELRLRAAETVDFEVQPQYSVVVTATDGNAAIQKMFVVSVIDDPGTPTIDVVPGSTTNSVRKKFDVAILSSSEFDATTRIDIASLTAGKNGTEDSLARHKKTGAIKFRLEDVNGDGLLDLIVTVEVKKTGLSSTDSLLRLQGLTSEGDRFALTDSISITGGQGKKGRGNKR